MINHPCAILTSVYDHAYRQEGSIVRLALEQTSCCTLSVNWHQIIEERSYEMHQVIADVLQRDPSALAKVVEWIHSRLRDPNYSVHSKDCLAEWLEIMENEGLKGVLAILNDRGEEGCRMRHNTPFAILMPQDKRLEILKRYESRRPRTSPAGV
jgi:hypothetical protein